jgi:hypothetical protein
VTCVMDHVQSPTKWDSLLGGVIAFVLPADCHLVEITDSTDRTKSGSTIEQLIYVLPR